MEFEGKDEEFVVDWLRREGFKEAVVEAFKGNELSYILCVFQMLLCSVVHDVVLDWRSQGLTTDHTVVLETIVVKKFALATGITK